MIFRGFLYRGWAKTPRGVIPAILVISALFALIHIQYDWFGILIVFFYGLFCGWARRWSGSTVLPLLLHVITNVWALIATMANAEWALITAIYEGG
jgi:membrane protease YdiL (CAAX protease family)